MNSVSSNLSDLYCLIVGYVCKADYQYVVRSLVRPIVVYWPWDLFFFRTIISLLESLFESPFERFLVVLVISDLIKPFWKCSLFINYNRRGFINILHFVNPLLTWWQRCLNKPCRSWQHLQFGILIVGKYSIFGISILGTYIVIWKPCSKAF